MQEISLRAEEIFKVGNYAITNGLFLSFIALLILSVFAWKFKKNIKSVPDIIQNIAEFLIESLLSLMDSVFLDRKKSEKYLPLIATIFIFILVSNWLGLLPGVGSFILHKEEGSIPLLRSPASDLNFTLALAIIAILSTNFFGVAALGFLMHIKKFFNFSNPIKFFVGILELLSEFSRMISFSFRLFGNVFAGEVLLTIVFFLAPYIAPIPFLFLEMFFGAIQALIFAMLTLVFLSIHTAMEEH
ncbi:MAG: ATP synthase F0 subunit A [Candidatus Nealsonbacteria bacterium RIFCSPHIGHO2_01_FULL_38_55]|uniref:ATP synthase subunit a n=2 Tax=Candidatus Nealsoniibacteriota TaxID=1817911 RepID=A0A1G2EIK9_9BACT|nr:MAG: ATP synthase subunit a [Parcubacteria group bacterium GW2011_GWA2_38_27]OGZ19620.1 MAG: ATP synthase F0 subunit A [Candidatus Nealsonbacteria bacterium RIFCSPHIGHO2_01_FULL_38_55]OGZ21413.1 MAG: ATP synthase F0 subunit A [Candidatus Nealsonbacteria bacterium RIFCSPHIGHO2_02_38_10]OGZ21890.1 MAG: ATP synthase F0 subunit A [Candidatus Nealsonbacteria bacterium RIFCSPHIGHO2_02_FULL_38_75]OGZ22706.1 MAG: ATP synthase F0 subunit A [Candidatus Nealsonbacteria bacterium RIFCSPLOWO2_01_FULL_38_